MAQAIDSAPSVFGRDAIDGERQVFD